MEPQQLALGQAWLGLREKCGKDYNGKQGAVNMQKWLIMHTLVSFQRQNTLLLS